MPRVRADDYDVKVQGIMDAAAEFFSRTGYPGAKMQDIAKACGASKSMLYHYFPTKDDLLFAMLREHLELIIETLENIHPQSKVPEKLFAEFVHSFLQKSAQLRRRNMVAMNDVKYLPKAMQTSLAKLQIMILDLVVDVLKQVNPNLTGSLYKMYALLLIGMLNWTDIWYKPSGPIKVAELVDRISRLFLRGFIKEK